MTAQLVQLFIGMEGSAADGVMLATRFVSCLCSAMYCVVFYAILF
jgi:hypothetical protein